MVECSIDKTVEEVKSLDENVSLGVALGYSVPIVCAINKLDGIFKIGEPQYFISQRIKIQNRYRKTQEALKFARGGHGRKRKLKALNNYREYERNFAKTYNHMISKEIVNIALKYSAKYIILEDFSDFLNKHNKAMYR